MPGGILNDPFLLFEKYYCIIARESNRNPMEPSYLQRNFSSEKGKPKETRSWQRRVQKCSTAERHGELKRIKKTGEYIPNNLKSDNKTKAVKTQLYLGLHRYD